MNDGSDHPDDLLGVYAVDAVDDPAERRRVEQHLATCDACRTWVMEHREVLAGLAGEVGPPPELWSRIAGELRSSHRPPVRLAGDPRRPRSGWLLAIAAAATILCGVGIGYLLGATEGQGIAELAAMARAEPTTQQLVLSGVDGAPAAEVLITTGAGSYFVATNLPPLPADQAYQLWALRGDDAISIGVLGDDPEALQLAPPETFDRLAVTVEPAGGSIAPSTDPVAVSPR